MGQRQSQTNAPLFYAQRLMSIYDQSSDTYDQNSHTSIQQDQHALLTGAWLCLKESWVSWLNELSTYMNLARIEGYQLNELELLLKAGLPEGQLLLGLLDTTESWLSIMLQRIVKPTERLKSMVKANDSTVALISLVSTDEVSEDLLIRQVLSEFKQYIESVRVRQIEW
ncbi:MAG: hypothetical protein ACI9T9_001805 [Oleiphilaceae bacterium]|jgi:hypothetical protein